MKKETVFFVVVALIVGLLVGLLVSKGGKKEEISSVSPGGVESSAFSQKIPMLEDMVARDPSNRNAWVELGHGYFDMNQPVKAIEAYTKALELDPNDANVLTDQGVMFRRLGWYDRAAENFQKASEIDPAHRQSLYNLGVVYRYDLQDTAKAKEAWTRFLAIDPAGAGADSIRKELQAMESGSTLAVPK